MMSTGVDRTAFYKIFRVFQIALFKLSPIKGKKMSPRMCQSVDICGGKIFQTTIFSFYNRMIASLSGNSERSGQTGISKDD